LICVDTFPVAITDQYVFSRTRIDYTYRSRQPTLLMCWR